MRSVLLALFAVLVFAGSTPTAFAAAEPPTTEKKESESPAADHDVYGKPSPDYTARWITIGAAALAVAFVGVLAARWSKSGPPDGATPPAA